MNPFGRLLRTAAIVPFSASVLLGGSLSMVLDNDVLFDSDDAYSGGIILNWMSDEYGDPVASEFSTAYIDGYRTLLHCLIPAAKDREYRNASLSLQQTIMTPENTDLYRADYNDFPYVGILSLTGSYYAWNADDFDEYRITGGLIGPGAGAEFSQKLAHDLTGNADPKGWDTQLGTEWFAGVGYMHGTKHLQTPLGDDLRFELFSSYNVDLESHYVGLNGGISFRIGREMPNNFQSISTLLGISSNRYLRLTPSNKTTSWAVHGGVFANFVAYSWIVEEAKDRGFRINDEPLFPTGNAGVDLYFDAWQLTFDLFPTRMYARNERTGSWVRMSLTYFY